MSGDGKIDQAKGRVKEAAGVLADDETLKDEGRAERLAGEAKEAAGKVVDRVKDAITGSEK